MTDNFNRPVDLISTIDTSGRAVGLTFAATLRQVAASFEFRLSQQQELLEKIQEQVSAIERPIKEPFDCLNNELASLRANWDYTRNRVQELEIRLADLEPEGDCEDCEDCDDD